jgi:DNA-binding HxlR family transcriptional regulator
MPATPKPAFERQAADARAVGTQYALRAGERALSLLATPLNLSILRALSRRPMRLAELRRAAGLPAQTTLRGHVGMLCEVGAVTKRPTRQPPYTFESELTPMGIGLLEVAAKLERWLGRAPGGPIPLESPAASGVVKAFVDGWSSTMMRGLAAGPTSLTELDREIAALSYPALERRLSSMRMANLIEPYPSAGAGTPYAVTEWARRGIVPLAAASRCEGVHMRERAAPFGPTEIEAAFMLAIPLVTLRNGASGSCHLEVQAMAGGLRREVGIEVTVWQGAIASCEPGAHAKPGAFAAGSIGEWFSAILAGEPGLLRIGGGRQLPEGLVSGLHAALAEG